jgi:hypothetical protein
MGWYLVHWIGLVHYRNQWKALVTVVMTLKNSGTILDGCRTGGLSNSAQLRRVNVHHILQHVLANSITVSPYVGYLSFTSISTFHSIFALIWF